MPDQSTRRGRGTKRDLFIIRVVGPYGCWVPEMTTNKHLGGYFRVRDGGRRIMLHRLIYERAIGPIPTGHDLHHEVCENPPCCATRSTFGR